MAPVTGGVKTYYLVYVMGNDYEKNGGSSNNFKPSAQHHKSRRYATSYILVLGLGCLLHWASLPSANGQITNYVTECTVTAPFIKTNGYVYQPATTSLANGGRAVYTFPVTRSGEYGLFVQVEAPNNSSNSLFVSVDAEPRESDIWHISATRGIEAGLVGRARTMGTNLPPEARIFQLSAGEHTVRIRGCEANVKIKGVMLTNAPQRPSQVNGLEAFR